MDKRTLTKLWVPCVSTDKGAVEMASDTVDPSSGMLPPITMVRDDHVRLAHIIVPFDLVRAGIPYEIVFTLDKM